MITLILLEILIINILLLMFNINILIRINQYLVIYFLIIVVCERVLILRILVIFVRFTGNDLLINKRIFPFK